MCSKFENLFHKIRERESELGSHTVVIELKKFIALKLPAIERFLVCAKGSMHRLEAERDNEPIIYTVSLVCLCTDR